MALSLWLNGACSHWRALVSDYNINDMGLGFVLKCFARGSYAVEQEVELNKNRLSLPLKKVHACEHS